MIANTGGDRLIDWIGEFDSYLTPFAPFGMATVSRTLQPQLPEYLYALSQSDGADPFLAAHYGSDPDAKRRAVRRARRSSRQHDAAWDDQKGKPRDPQAGNRPGVHRDVHRTAGIRPINSPDTDPPAAGAAPAVAPAAPGVEMAAWVGVRDVTAGAARDHRNAGAVATYTITDGTHSVSGSGVIRSDGKVAFAVDLSSLVDGTLTATARLSVGGLTSAAGTTTAVKDTTLPPSLGIALPGYVGLLGSAAAPVAARRAPGNYVEWTHRWPRRHDHRLRDARQGHRAAARLRRLHRVLGRHLLGHCRSVQQGGQLVAGEHLDADLTLDTLAPTGTFTVNGAASNAALTKNPALTLQLSFADSFSGIYQYQISDRRQDLVAVAGVHGLASVTLPSADGTYIVFVSVADKAGNTLIATQKVILDRTGRDDRRGAVGAEQRHVLRRRHADRAHVDGDRSQRRRARRSA